MKTIRLTTPTQYDLNQQKVELEAGDLERWLKDLPTNDIFTTVEKLNEAVSAFNEVKVEPEIRSKLLEIYLEAFNNLLIDYDEMRIAQLKVSTRQKQKLSNDILWLYIKLSHGYKIIVKDHVGEENPGKPGFLLLTTFRAIELTMTSFLYACRFGLATPPLTDIELHQLYAFAEYNELAEKPVKSAKGYAKSPTIRGYYTLAMIFINLDPGHYESYTLEMLFIALQPFTFNCGIKSNYRPSDRDYVFKINLGENRVPTFVVNRQPGNIKETTRFLDIKNFIRELEAWIKENKKNADNLLIGEELELFRDVLQRLKGIQDDRRCKSVEQSLGPLSEQDVQLVFGIGPLEGLLIAQSAGFGMQLNYKLSEWSVQLETETSCELASHMDLVQDELLLGDLVGLVSGGDDDNPVNLLKVAYLSRIQQLPQGVLLADLEYLSGEASPLTYMMINKNGVAVESSQFNGILMKGRRAGDIGEFMIVQREHYQELQQYFITTREKVRTLEATRLIRMTLRHAFFQFKVIKEEINDSQETTDVMRISA